MRRSILSALMVIAFTGTAHASADVYGRSFEEGVLSTFTYAAVTGEFNTIVLGNPFSLPSTDVETAITTAMQGNHQGPRTRFTTNPGPAARKNFRAVFAFDVPRNMLPDALCGDLSALRLDNSARRLYITAVFCAGDRLQSMAEAALDRSISPRGAGFAQTVRMMTRRLFRDRTSSGASD